MKKNDLTDIKALDINTLQGRIRKIKAEITDLVIDKNMNKLADVKSISKKRKDLSQIMTVLRQKELLGVLESEVEQKPSFVKATEGKKGGKAGSK